MTTTYLTKKEHGKTYHFRATVEDTGVSIVDGIFYNWLDKYVEGCGNNAAAVEKQKQLVEEKLSEGYRVTDFVALPENTVDVYDKAKWHYEGDFPEDQDSFQAYIHTGMFLGWLIDNNLVSEDFRDDFWHEIKDFQDGELTGPAVFLRCCDGVLTIDQLSETGNRFALSYFEFEHGQYLKDYEEVVGQGLPSIYHVDDTWENYDKLKAVLNTRFAEWKAQNQ
jgi:hypothetical protein